MAFEDTLSDSVDDIFGTAFDQRDGRVVPETDDVSSTQAVKIEGAFLYADLAGSAKIAQVCPWDTTAKIIKAYLDCAVRLIRVYGGHIRSFDGDRVMGVFMGDRKNSDAADCAREIDWATERIIQPKAAAKFNSVKNNDVKIRQACGIDSGDARAVRAGIRGNNDLIWIGKPPSMAAKLSDVREYPYSTFISSRVYAKLRADAKKVNGKDIWEKRSFTFAGEAEVVYRSSWMKKP